MSNVSRIDDKRNWYAALALCCACMHRWYATFPEGTSVLELECPACSVQDSFVSFLPVDRGPDVRQ